MSAQIQLLHSNEVGEPELIDKAQKGDKKAFQQLYQIHHKRVYGLCFRLAGQEYLAEEAMQDTFVCLWQKLPQFRGESQFSTWLHSLTVNQALSCIKKHNRFWSRFSQMTEQSDQVSTPYEYEMLDKMMVRLPERARIIFVLFAVEGYKHEEIAKLLGIAQGTSKAQYHRARKLLQEML